MYRSTPDDSMSTRLELRLFRESDPAAFLAALERAALEQGGKITWNTAGKGKEDLRVSSRGSVHSLYVPYQDRAYQFCLEAGRCLNCPWIEIRIQEGSLWDYALYRGAELADKFSVAPEYWEDPDDVTDDYLHAWRGKPEVLSKLWGLPLSAVDRYLVSWGFHLVDEDTSEFRLKGKAYPEDKYEYGNPDQMYDVLRVLGGEFPATNHTLILPSLFDFRR